jgi:hypothetical protein
MMKRPQEGFRLAIIGRVLQHFVVNASEVLLDFQDI